MIKYNHVPPLLLVDADEVLLQFVVALETFLEKEGYELRLESFRLAGNLYHKKTQTAVTGAETGELIKGFFDSSVDKMTAVAGASDSLSHLSQYFDIKIVSNVPQHCRKRRAANLASLGMPYPLIANKGDKGPIIEELTSNTETPSVFIDDLPNQHASVKQYAPDTHRIHFIADKRLQKLISKAPDAHYRIDCWYELTEHLVEFAKTASKT